MKMSIAKYRKLDLFLLLLAMGAIIVLADKGQAITHRESKLPGWRTNMAKRTIELNELEPGGPGKGGIPAIDRPVFVATTSAEKWRKNFPAVVYEK